MRSVTPLLIVLLIGCDYTLREWKKEPFNTLSWKAGEEILFQPKIDDITRTYDVVIGVRHMYGAQIRELPVLVKILSPSGKEFINKYTVEVTTPEGKPLASCAGDLCDLERNVGELVFEEPGKYQFRISHTEERTIRGIMEFGLILKAKD